MTRKVDTESSSGDTPGGSGEDAPGPFTRLHFRTTVRDSSFAARLSAQYHPRFAYNPRALHSNVGFRAWLTTT